MPSFGMKGSLGTFLDRFQIFASTLVPPPSGRPISTWNTMMEEVSDQVSAGGVSSFLTSDAMAVSGLSQTFWLSLHGRLHATAGPGCPGSARDAPGTHLGRKGSRAPKAAISRFCFIGTKNKSIPWSEAHDIRSSSSCKSTRSNENFPVRH